MKTTLEIPDPFSASKGHRRAAGQTLKQFRHGALNDKLGSRTAGKTAQAGARPKQTHSSLTKSCARRKGIEIAQSSQLRIS